MPTISRFTVSNAQAIDATNWLTLCDTFGPQEIPDSAPRGDCIVQAITSPLNSAAEWAQIVWIGGEAIPGSPNQRRVKRMATGSVTITASIGASTQKLVLWIMWAEVSILTKGSRPRKAKSWSEGMLFPGPDQCGAHETESMVMGKNARGQIIAVAKLFPSSVGRVIQAASKHTLFNIRRQVTANDYVDGTNHKHKKSFVAWAEDTAAGMQVLNTAESDELYDTDGPDLPTGTTTSETYNNFRQWLDWDGRPCSNYAYWYFRARWKNQAVTLKDVGPGSITLPNQAFYKKK